MYIKNPNFTEQCQVFIKKKLNRDNPIHSPKKHFISYFLDI